MYVCTTVEIHKSKRDVFALHFVVVVVSVLLLLAIACLFALICLSLSFFPFFAAIFFAFLLRLA